jgi:hypothetical protein
MRKNREKKKRRRRKTKEGKGSPEAASPSFSCKREPVALETMTETPHVTALFVVVATCGRRRPVMAQGVVHMSSVQGLGTIALVQSALLEACEPRGWAIVAAGHVEAWRPTLPF